MKHKIISFYLWGGLTIAFIGLAIIGFWAFFPYKIIDFNNLPYPVENKVVKQGGQLKYTVDYCKYTEGMPAEVKREFIDGLVFESSDVRANVTLGCNSVVVPLNVPLSLPPGKYKLRLTVTYHPNPIREVIFINESEEFVVVRNDVGAYGPTPSESNLQK
jgi:hypothetical protein